MGTCKSNPVIEEAFEAAVTAVSQEVIELLEEMLKHNATLVIEKTNGYLAGTLRQEDAVKLSQLKTLAEVQNSNN